MKFRFPVRSARDAAAADLFAIPLTCRRFEQVALKNPTEFIIIKPKYDVSLLIKMRYCISDIHGEYDLFCRLMEYVKFSDSDELFVLGDMTDKGNDTVALCNLLRNVPNIHCILGNHECDFLKAYHGLMKNSDGDFDEVSDALRRYFPGDGKDMSFDIVDWLDSLPLYFEEEDFIGVHASVGMDESGAVLPFSETPYEEFVYSRALNGKDVFPRDAKCIVFGHTPVRNISGDDRFLFYPRSEEAAYSRDIRDYCKIHIDTGVYLGGILGCLCVDDCTAYYLKRKL